MVNLGDVFPDFEADSTIGKIKFHDFIGDKWCVLFSHPADYTPVCTTELGKCVQLTPEFEKRGVKMIALSCDDIPSHQGWSQDIMQFVNQPKDKFPFPIISDKGRDLAVSLGMVDPEEKDKAGIPLTCRAVFVIGPDKKLKLSMHYPATTGRNFAELLRCIDSLQLTMNKKVATPEGWTLGGKCMVLPSIPQEGIEKVFPKGVDIKQVPSGKSYLRYTPQPE
ncbi:peroxiredoxin-6-like [Saccostrea echinata]|uniref:peroxiredoxin-6-like n=1 Tax=Saccostrea echinata TaxID=191078 RepID=UPI002A820960|nr:peroxiredoxin-6-like [Saccostrea echinata]